MHCAARRGFLQAAALLLALAETCCSQPGPALPESPHRRQLQRVRSGSSVSSFAFGFPVNVTVARRWTLLHIFLPASRAAGLPDLQPFLHPPACSCSLSRSRQSWVRSPPWCMVVCSCLEALKPSSGVGDVVKTPPTAIGMGDHPAFSSACASLTPQQPGCNPAPCRGARLGPRDAWGEWWECSGLPDTICHLSLEDRVPSTGRDLSYAPLCWARHWLCQPEQGQGWDELHAGCRFQVPY